MPNGSWQGCSKHKKVKTACQDCWCPRYRYVPKEKTRAELEREIISLKFYARQAIIHFEGGSNGLAETMQILKREVEKP